MRNLLRVWAFVGTQFIVSLPAIAEGPDTLWVRTFGGINPDVGYSVQQTLDSGYIITGETWSYGSGGADVWLVKTDVSGNKLWDKTFGGDSSDIGQFVQQTIDSGYIITGWTESYGVGDKDVWLIRTDASGNKLWDKTFGGTSYDWGYSVQQTNDGGYIIIGTTNSYGVGYLDVWLIRTDASGNKLWDKTFGGSEHDYGYSVQQTLDGGYIITGETMSYGPGFIGIWLIKTDASGNKSWDKTFGGSGTDYGYSVQQTLDSGYIITGKTSYYGAGDEVWLIKTDASGDPIWAKTFGGPNRHDRGYSVQQTKDAGYIITGYTCEYHGGTPNVFIIRTNPLGDTLWTKILGGSGYEGSYSVQQTLDGGYIITGETNSYGAGHGDVWLIKIKPETGVEERNERLEIGDWRLLIYPNPSFGNALIKYGLPEKASISLGLYDISGRLVRTIYSGTQEKGYHKVNVGAYHDTPTGIYFIRLDTGDYKTTRKLTILK